MISAGSTDGSQKQSTRPGWCERLRGPHSRTRRSRGAHAARCELLLAQRADDYRHAVANTAVEVDVVEISEADCELVAFGSSETGDGEPSVAQTAPDSTSVMRNSAA